MPKLWADDLGSQDMRACVLLLALDAHFHTIANLSRSSYEFRDELGYAYLQLMSLLRNWAIESKQLHIRENIMRGGVWLSFQNRLSFSQILELPEEQRNALLSEDFRKIIEKFIDGSLDPILPSLTDASPLPQPPSGFSRRPEHTRKRHLYEVDVSILQAIYSFLGWQPLPNGEEERTERIALWREILECSIRTFATEEEPEAALVVEDNIYQEDHWLLNVIALLILEMESQERPEDFWQPIFNLGKFAHDYVEHFIDAFIRYILAKSKDGAIKINFVRLWSEMIAYASESPAWNDTSGYSGRYVNDLWQKLMGLRWFDVSPWQEEHQTLIKAMSSSYQSFCLKKLQGPYTMGKYLYFLLLPAAQPIRLDSLLWIESSLTDYHFEANHANVESGLANLVVLCWSEHQSAIRQSVEKFECYKRLIRQLVNRQNPVAMELQDKIMHV